MTEHADGIYFGLPEAEYLADPALSASSIGDLLVSPICYWRNSAMNPDLAPREETAALTFGTHLHALLAGEASPYVIKPAGMSFATKEGKAFREANAGRGFIGEDQNALARNIAAIVHEAVTMTSPDMARIAASEVSIFWTEDGLRRRARFDRLTPFAAIDWKTFQNSGGMDAERAIARAVANYRYHIRGAWYAAALAALSSMAWAKRPPVFGDDGGLIAAIAAEPVAPANWFVFIESCAYPEIAVRRFVKYAEDGTINGYWRHAENEIDRALRTFKRYSARYGNAPWIERQDGKAFDDADFDAARWIVERVE